MLCVLLKLFCMNKMLVFFLFAVVLFTSCEKSIPTDELNNNVQVANVEKDFNIEGGALTTKQGVEVVVPQGAFREKGKVVLISPREHPQLPQNVEGVRYVNKPLSIKIQAGSLYVPIDLRIPIEEGVDPKNLMVLVVFEQSKSLRAIKSDQEEVRECMLLKSDQWSKNVIHAKFSIPENAVSQTKYNKPGFTEYHVCVLELEKKKKLIERSEQGLLLVVTDPVSKPIRLSANYSVDRNDSVLVLVHGWTSSPSACWSVFVNSTINGNIKAKKYSKILTFGYDSGRHINENGKYFAECIKAKLKGCKVDIVAHSMGGLVARSAIEDNGASDYVRALITLGTPHKGVDLAAPVPFVNSVFKKTDSYFDYYNVDFQVGETSQGLNDLAFNSDFISNLSRNSRPSTRYFMIAGVHSYRKSDGIVALSSAINGSKSNEDFSIFEFKNPFNHSLLTDDTRVISCVHDKLKEFSGESYRAFRNTVFEDNFSRSTLDLSKWVSTNNSGAVKVHEGVLRIEQNVTDAKIELLSKHRYQASQFISLSRKVALYPAGENFFPMMSLDFENGKRLIVEYSQHAYINKQGLYIQCFDEKSQKISVDEKIHNNVFNTWFNEKVEIDVVKNQLKYYLNGTLLRRVQLKGLSLSIPFRVRMHPYGWYTGHKHCMDDFRLEVR